MTTALVQVPEIKYSIADDAIDALREQYMPLEIASIDDKNGFNAVHTARMDVRERRVAVEKERQNLKRGILDAGKAVDDEAKRITALLSPIESHLEKEEARYKKWLDDRKREAEIAAQAKLNKRLDALAAVGAMRHPKVVAVLTDEEFEQTLADCRREKEERDAAEAEAAEARRNEEERLRVEREELAKVKAQQEAELAEKRRVEEERLAAERKETEERLAKEREAIEAEKRRQAEEQARLDAEKERIEAEAAERQRLVELERAKAEAAERARKEAEQKQQREAEEAKRQAEADEAERRRIESLRPDHEKLLGVAEAVSAIEIPDVSPAAADVAGEVRMLLTNAASRIRAAANLLVKSSAA